MRFGEWLPDMPAAEAAEGALVTCINGIPTAAGYIPAKALVQRASALSARVIAAAVARRNTGVTLNFAGTATALNLCYGVTWADRSKGGGYSSSTTRWEFAQYVTGTTNLLIATNYQDAPQKWDLTADHTSGATLWADLSGSPPKASCVGVSDAFVIFGDVYESATAYPNRLRWSKLGDPQNWTEDPTVTQASHYDLPFGGKIKRIVPVGGAVLVFCEQAIWRMQYVGLPLIWDFQLVEDARGTFAPGGVVSYGGGVFYLDEDGFQATGGAQSTAIGANKINQTFVADVNQNYLDRISAGVDERNRLILWAYVSVSNTDPDPYCDKVIAFAIDQGRWVSVDFGEDLEVLASGETAAVTLDDLNYLFGTLENVIPVLDDPFWVAGRRYPAVFTSTHTLKYPVGSNLAAQFETGDLEPVTGRRSVLQRVRPLADGDTASVTAGYRQNTSDSVTYGSAAAPNTSGYASPRTCARFHRVRLDLAAGDTWTKVSGAEIQVAERGAA